MMWRQTSISILALCFSCVPPTQSTTAQELAFEVPANIRQLFLDDYGIAHSVNTVRKVHPPLRHSANPIVRPDTPWERGCQVYGTVCFDEANQKFRMWYLTGPKDRGNLPLKLGSHERAPHTTLAAYAESTDGIHWIKPKLNIFPYDGSRENNLLGIGRYNCEGISVLYDPRDSDPNKRWKCAYWDHGSGGWEIRTGGPFCMAGSDDGWHVAFSPDGIHWQPFPQNPVIKKYCDTNQNIVFDKRLNKYVGFSRFGFGRRLARTESIDFIHWSEPQLVLECDEADGPKTQIYGAGVDIYQGVYLAMLWIYREGIDGTIDTQLATSRDGIRWTRVGNRATWLKLGTTDSWEGGMVRSVERIIQRGKELYIYYCGIDGAHTGPNVKQVVRKHPVQIGLLIQRLDGFASLHSGHQPGVVLTKPFRLSGNQISVNCDADEGELHVEVLDMEGRIRALAKTSVDQVNQPLAWSQGSLASLIGKKVQLKFTLRAADLFSYWVHSLPPGK